MGLRQRIMLLVAIGLVVVTVPLSIMGLGMARAATDQVLSERLVMARATAAHIDERLAAGWRLLDQLAAQVAHGWIRGDHESAARALAGVDPLMTLFSGGIFLVDRHGRPIARVPADLLIAPRRLGELPSLRETLSAGRYGVSPLTTGTGGALLVTFTVPVRAPDQAVLGAVGGVINLSRPTLQAFVDHLSIGKSGHAAIVNEQGVVLASTDPAEVFTRDEHPQYLAQMIREGRAVVGSTEESHGPSGVERHVMAFAPLGPVPWGLAIGQSEEETFGPFRRLRDRVILFDLVALLAALLFAWLDTGAVLAPLRLLKEGSERIASGDLERRVEVRRADEIGALARSFETMRAHLLRSLEEIRRRARASQSLYELGTGVLSLQGREAVFQSVVDRAVTLLGGDVAVLCLLDEAGLAGRVRAVAGAATVGSKEAPVPVGSDGQLRCLDCDAVAPTYRRSQLTAPLRAGDRTVGALCVGRQAERPFAQEDREVLDGLAALAALAVENARLQERVQSAAVLEERERIAREMHDGAGQVLGYVNTKVQAVRALLEAGRTVEARAHLAQLEEAARGAYADLREAILGLRTVIAPDRRLTAVLQEYVRQFSEVSGVTTVLVVEGDPSAFLLSPEAELQLIRIIQEALTNVRKHAMAHRAWVRFATDDGAITVTVADDGVGIDRLQPPAGEWPKFGLQTMRERAEAIGGAFAIRPRQDGGTEVVVHLPKRGW